MKNAFNSLLLVGALAAAPSLAIAQTAAAQATPAALGSVAGTVADSLSREPLAFATVILLPVDAQNALSTMTTDKGAFSLAGVPAGQYTLLVRYLGYKESAPVAVAVAAGRSTAVAPLALAADRHVLAGVTVTATKAFIEQRADKLVLNVAASPIAAGGTAHDVLSRAPGVLESGAGYSLRGKTVTVLLDGKYTNLSGEELKSMLSAMPGSTLDKVEVIANPSAKYDAQGAAVINIITTKSRKFGTNGVLTAGTGAGRYGRYNAGLTLNHRADRLNIYGGLDRLESKTYATTRAVRSATSETQLQENGLETRRNASNSLRAGLDYDLSKNSSAGVLLKGMLSTRSRDGQNTAELNTTRGLPLSESVVNTVGTAKVLSPSVNLYYKTKLDTLGKELRLNADYFGYNKASGNTYATSFTDEFSTGQNPDFLRDNSPASNSVKSLSADYSQPFYKGNLEAGLKTTFTTTDNDIRWEQAPAGQPWTLDLGKTNHFIYRENINAAYATYSRSIKKTEVQVGLRAEQTNTTGTSLTLNQTNERHYLNFFPSFSAQYNQSEKVQLGFSYSRKIDRFRFGIVNPFVNYISQYRYAQGNPNIRPSFSHNFEFTHSYSSLLSTSLSYGHHTDVLIETYRKDDATQVVVNSFGNFRSAESLDGSMTLMKPLLNGKWTTVTTAGFSFAKVNDGSVGLRNARPAAMLSTNHTLALAKGLKAEVSGMYMSPLTFGGVAFKSRFYTGFGISKSVLKDLGTLTLNVTDVFNTQQNRYSVLANGINSRNVDQTESRFVKLNFSYKFGNKNVKASQRRSTGIEGEKSRMDN
ncbi:outer membrane beta-barrel family protein [Hymenobacter arizonensis]|uniref:Outer membrane receptor proteins, mostly Fe transport n=1 Tax=Hymenobacter arizonensis TaxID=1227077 RepID=A0A1I6AE66_HYMAR|nr:outer membrane beta-barrel family protein [Hymenobacter arizonensis]SFQ66981.1 Outer membrane receptor proteins, mostly Fe transport [Hymenobacter arizonensis]